MLLNSAKLSDKSLSFFYFLAIATTVFVVGAYFFIVYHYSVNIPFWDDYTHLDVITDITVSDSFIEKLQLLVSFHNEHRIVFARLATLAAMLVEGDLNFVTLILLGNLSVLGIGILLFLNFYSNKNKDYRWRVICFLPVIFLLFNLAYFEASIWAIAALSSLVVIFLSFLCILVLVRSKERRYGWIFFAFFLGVLSAGTQGNGLLVLYVGAFLLVLQKRFTASVFWSIGTAITTLLYFYNYTSLGYGPDYTGLFSTLVTYLNYFFSFLGSWSNGPLLVGILFSVLFLLAVFSGLWRKNPAIFGFILFLLASAFAATVTRAGFGVWQALSPRYKIYSLLFFALLYMALFEFLERPRLAKAARYLVPGAFIYVIIFYLLHTMPIALDEIAAHKQELVSGLKTWKKQGKGLSHWDQKLANKILTRAIHKGVYHPPTN